MEQAIVEPVPLQPVPLHTPSGTSNWSKEEDSILLSHQKILGNKWTEISKALSGRTDNAVKNRFATLSNKGKSSLRRRRSSRADESKIEEIVRSPSRRKKVRKRRALRSSPSGPVPIERLHTNAHAYQHLGGDPMYLSQTRFDESHPAQLAQVPDPHLPHAPSVRPLISVSLPGLQMSRQYCAIRGPAMPEAVAGPSLACQFVGDTLPLSDASVCTTLDAGSWHARLESYPLHPEAKEEDQHLDCGSWGAQCMAPQDTSQSFPANSYTSSTSHAKSASWTEDALDGWMAENMTSEDIDDLLPALSALLPDLHPVP